jgi:hypothetical protein
MKNIILHISLFLLLFSVAKAQSVEVEYNDEKVLLTQNIDERFLGTYTKNEGKRKLLYKLDKAGSESYSITQIYDNNDKAFAWDVNEKQNLEWGALLQNGQPAYMQVKEFENGEMKTYKGLVIIYKDLKTQKYKDMLLYEVNGTLVLGGLATKVSETVSN